MRSNPLKLSSERIHRFTCGDCHMLAKALDKRCSWSLATFVLEPEGAPHTHAFVLSPDKTLALDVEGKRPLAEFRKDWFGCYEIKTWSLGEFAQTTWWQEPSFGHYSYALARKIAGDLIDFYGLT